MAERPGGTISKAMPLKRVRVTSVAMTGVMRSPITIYPFKVPIRIPATRVTRKAGTNENPLRIIQANTTALRLMALPTDRSM
jgi:hypothetical protein